MSATKANPTKIVSASNVTGLGSAALQATSAFDASGTAAAQKVQTFANSGARGTAAPAYTGQLGVQLSDNTIWQATGTSAGNWVQIAYVTTSLVNAANGVAGLDSNGDLTLPIILYNTQVSNAGFTTFSNSVPRLGQPYASVDYGIFGIGDGVTSILGLPNKIDTQWGGCIGFSGGALQPDGGGSLLFPGDAPGWLIIGGYTTPYVMSQLAATAIAEGSPAPAATYNVLYMDQNGVDGSSCPILLSDITATYQIVADIKQGGLRIGGQDVVSAVFKGNVTGRTNVITNVNIDISSYDVGSSLVANGFGSVNNPIVAFHPTTPGAADNTITLQYPIVTSGTNKIWSMQTPYSGTAFTFIDHIQHSNFGTTAQSHVPVVFGTAGIQSSRVASTNRATSISPATVTITMVSTNQFSIGETVTQVTSGATGTVAAWTSGVGLTITAVSGAFDGLNLITGSTSQAVWKPAGIQYMYTMSAGSGNFVGGETVTQATSGATGTVQSWSSGILIVNPSTGTFDATHAITGSTSGTSRTPASWQFAIDVQGNGNFLAGEGISQGSAFATVISWDSVNRILVGNVSSGTFTTTGPVSGGTSLTYWTPSSVTSTSNTLDPTHTAGVYTFSQLSSGGTYLVTNVPSGGGTAAVPVLSIGEEMVFLITTASDGSVNTINFDTQYKVNSTFPDGSMFITKFNALLAAPRTSITVSAGGTGTFKVGETITQATSGAAGVCYSWDGTSTLVVNVTSGTFDNSHACTGSTSGASWTASAVTNIAKRIRVRWTYDTSTPAGWVPVQLILQ